MLADALIILTLVLINGAFAMSEIAIVSSRRPRLAQLAGEGSAGARHALALADQPTRFLSSVQVGITSIGILSGAIGEVGIASRIRIGLEQVPVLAPYAEKLSLAIMVIVVTYVSLILGELVPKRLAMTHPERIATVIARPMDLLARIGQPLVSLLSVSTDAILRVLGVRATKQPAVTLEEIRILFQQGTAEGVLEPGESEMVTNVLNLDDRHVGAALTPRSEVVFLDTRDPQDRIREKLRQDPHPVLPLCDGGLDRVLGFVRSTRVLDQMLDNSVLDLPKLAEAALFVPESMTLMSLLEHFKRTHLPVALVVDEFGSVEGLVSLTDVISAIVGDLPTESNEERAIVRREDGSWLLDGALDLETVARTIGADALLANDARQHYHTLGGLVMLATKRIPRTGDVFQRGGFRFEVVDMDGHRVDRVLVSRDKSTSASAPSSNAGGQ
jgi:putative hemolysin